MFEARFQTFDDTSDPSQVKARAAALRRTLKAQGLDGFIVPRADEHQSEYVPACAERLAWLTGFTGSAGLAMVLRGRGALFIDGRYTLQVQDQTDTAVFVPVPVAEITPAQWLARNARASDRIGYDPWLTTKGSLESWQKALQAKGAELVPVERNPVDMVWTDRPRPPCGKTFIYPDRLAGEDSASKLARLREKMADANALVLSDPHDVAWLFNIRGRDVDHTPLVLCYALVPAKGKPSIFIDPAKLDDDVARILRKRAHIEKPNALIAALRKLGRARASVMFDAQTAAVKLIHTVEEARGKAQAGASPVRTMKAVKNRTELKGARAAHLRDGAAMVRFLAWFNDNAPAGKLTEIDAVEALESFRRDTGKLEDVSFPTISGAGPNGAIVHYRVTQATNRRIGKGLFLLDSGAQYRDGTTDITRTLSVGTPTRAMREAFTRVLKGHIAVARAVFPKGTSGAQLDAFARQSLWEAGLDYDHGTGHGVGAFLSVHEGPQNISKRPSVALQPGMILSNEPGYYKAGAWGIRIENLVVVTKAGIKDAERESYCFETLTLAPIDLRLVETKLMTRDELRWLDQYHARVRKELSPLLDPATRKWLTQATRPLARK